MHTREQKYRYNATARAKSAAKSIAAGRVPGRRGFAPKLTEAERRENRRLNNQKWKDKNPEKWLEIKRRSMKKSNDAKAIAAGFTPGVIGRRAKPITPEQKRAKQNARVKKYYHAHKETSRAGGAAAARNRRARLKKVGGTHTAADIAKLRSLQKDNCTWCLQPLGDKTPHVDHHIPLSKGGSNDVRNLHLMHSTCNLKKLYHDPVEYGLRHNLLAW